MKILLMRAKRDHPRLCGEKFALSFLLALLPGSPPPMRGKVYAYSVLHAVVRITPAYAGKSVHFCISSPYYKDHPRLCGEKFHENTSNAGKKGSPPPMRGKDDSHLMYATTSRITPAYAGKRSNLCPCMLIV